MNKNQIQTHFKTPWVELKSRPFDSSFEPYYYLDLPDYTSILTVNNREVLVVQQFRAACDKLTTELPSGLIDKNETAEQAIIRECREETGYEPIHPKLIFKGKVDPGRLNNTQWIFFSDKLIHNPLPQPEENLICKRLSLLEFEKAIQTEEINSSSHVLAWLIAKEKGLIKL